MSSFLDDQIWTNNLNSILENIERYKSATGENKIKYLGDIHLKTSSLSSLNPSRFLFAFSNIKDKIARIEDFAKREFRLTVDDLQLEFLGHILIYSCFLYEKISSRETVVSKLKDLEKIFEELDKSKQGFTSYAITLSLLTKRLLAREDLEGKKYFEKTIDVFKRYQLFYDPVFLLEKISFVEFAMNSGYLISDADINEIMGPTFAVIKKLVQLFEEENNNSGVLPTIVLKFASISFLLGYLDAASWCFQKILPILEKNVKESLPYLNRNQLILSLSKPVFTYTPGEELFNSVRLRQREEQFNQEMIGFLKREVLEDTRCRYIEAVITLAEIYLRYEKYDEALNLLNEKIPQFEDVFSMYVAFQPTYARYLEIKAEINLHLLGELEKAISLMEEAINIRRRSSIFSSKNAYFICRGILFIGSVYFSKRNFKLSELYYLEFFKEIKKIPNSDRKLILPDELFGLAMLIGIKIEQQAYETALNYAKRFLNFYIDTYNKEKIDVFNKKKIEHRKVLYVMKLGFHYIHHLCHIISEEEYKNLKRLIKQINIHM